MKIILLIYVLFLMASCKVQYSDALNKDNIYMASYRGECLDFISIDTVILLKDGFTEIQIRPKNLDGYFSVKKINSLTGETFSIENYCPSKKKYKHYIKVIDFIKDPFGNSFSDKYYYCYKSKLCK